MRALSRLVGDEREPLDDLTAALAELDLALARAALSRAWAGCRVEPAGEVELRAARHPLLEPASAVPIDLPLEGVRALVVSGPEHRRQDRGAEDARAAGDAAPVRPARPGRARPAAGLRPRARRHRRRPVDRREPLDVLGPRAAPHRDPRGRGPPLAGAARRAGGRHGPRRGRTPRRGRGRAARRAGRARARDHPSPRAEGLGERRAPARPTRRWAWTRARCARSTPCRSASPAPRTPSGSPRGSASTPVSSRPRARRGRPSGAPWRRCCRRRPPPGRRPTTSAPRPPPSAPRRRGGPRAAPRPARPSSSGAWHAPARPRRPRAPRRAREAQAELAAASRRARRAARPRSRPPGARRPPVGRRRPPRPPRASVPATAASRPPRAAAGRAREELAAIAAAPPADRRPVAVGDEVVDPEMGFRGRVVSIDGGRAEVQGGGARMRLPLARLVADPAAPARRGRARGAGVHGPASLRPRGDPRGRRPGAARGRRGRRPCASGWTRRQWRACRRCA